MPNRNSPFKIPAKIIKQQIKRQKQQMPAPAPAPVVRNPVVVPMPAPPVRTQEQKVKRIVTRVIKKGR